MKDDISHIKKILQERFKKFSIPDSGIKKEVVAAIEEICGFTIDPKEIQIKNKIVFIKASQGTKNEIFLKRIRILEKLNLTLKTKAPTDIR